MALTRNQQQFVEDMLPYATEASRITGVDPGVIISQAALESNWGQSAPNNNYFGIKGSGAVLPTSEFVNGSYTPTNASFRTYGTPSNSFLDWAGLITGNPRYAGVMEAPTPQDQIAALGKSGYATDPHYATKLGSIYQGIRDLVPQETAYDPSQAASADAPPSNYLSNVMGYSPQANPFASQMAAASEAAGIQPAAAPAMAAVPDTAGEDLTIGGNPPAMGQATVIQPSSIPKGPYGVDAVVRATASGNTAQLKVALDKAKSAMWSAMQGPQGVSFSDIKTQMDAYLAQVAQVAPGAMRDVQAVIQQNPQIATMAAPIMPQLNAAFKSLPQPQTVTMPLPVARPDVMVAQTPATATPTTSPQQTPAPDWSQIAAYRPSTGTTGASEPQSWGQMAANTAGNIFNAFGNFLGGQPAQAATPPTGNSPISPELGITSYRPSDTSSPVPISPFSSSSAAIAPRAPASVYSPYNAATAAYSPGTTPSAAAPPAPANSPVTPPDPAIASAVSWGNYQLPSGQALPTPQSLMASMMAGTLPMATPAQPVAIVPTATALQKPVYSPYNVATAAYSPGSSGVSGTLRNGSGSYSGGSRGSNGAVYSPSSVTVGGQTYHPMGGSTVISPSGTIMSPSEAISAMSSGNWKRGGRVKAYDPVLK